MKEMELNRGNGNGTKFVYLQTNHCRTRDTYSLFTVVKGAITLHEFNGYAATANPNEALRAAVELRKQGYQLIHFDRYREVMIAAERLAIEKFIRDL